jgi:hypothetical protein
LQWFRKDLFSFIFDELLSEEKIAAQGIFTIDIGKKMRQQLMSASGGNSTEQLWAIIVFQYWYDKNMTA